MAPSVLYNSRTLPGIHSVILTRPKCCRTLYQTCSQESNSLISSSRLERLLPRLVIVAFLVGRYVLFRHFQLVADYVCDSRDVVRSSSAPFPCQLRCYRHALSLTVRSELIFTARLLYCNRSPMLWASLLLTVIFRLLKVLDCFWTK